MPIRPLAALLLLLAFPLGAMAQTDRSLTPAPLAQERHSEVRLLLPSAGADGRLELVRRLAAQGVHLGHARVEETAEGPALRTVLSQSELAAARAAGAPVEVLVADLAAEVAARPAFPEAARRAALARGGVSGNVFGSMGGFPTFAEAVAILDDMRAQYPHLITAKTSLGQSHEGREIWMVEVSDNPGVDEPEAEVLITALHHAREPASLTTTLYTLWHLLENYGADPEVTALVDGRRLFVVPVLNPDGYVYNQTTDPNGGGYWRKNRRPGGGVDLNRNYGYAWGYDNLGSSPYSWSSTYRGPGPFSEPETQALRDFLEGRRVRMAFNYHTYGDLLLFPWAYTPTVTPDHPTFVDYAQRLTAANGYEYGNSPSILYPSNGNSNDWMYGEQTAKPKILCYTPEVGHSFWPSASQIVPLAQENLAANLELLRLASFEAEYIPLTGARATTSGAVTPGAATPNPFAGTTTLRFALEEDAEVRLAVYDVLGREVAVLLDGAAEAGAHEAVFDAAGLPAGTYLWRLVVGGEAEGGFLTLVR